ncbi:phosphatidylinositol-glycan biosynthesis class S protein (macronuclear) [Tetrahymena thermophila SB210]|uniref:Phosphatidylinositol-glycan biosynthesis class S protein n=1 Tax=Tetrahymena thermophila (strain SB210) TaxID=312017 RepID=Q22BH3_TETTS|nr:phosphatidylinositol-glycan biosynthesis class S protein [Tetrahymena thermophila SB210]EAR82631.2 phosphatidylinositol-glycan biosynthesis class S protein [Tetrahymena thermophila SB210]|eukprot:XP_001030294.2 phosphatidylinositol-glycan biosynthesis class S protein [Tetrahymena thermophila SB210]
MKRRDYSLLNYTLFIVLVVIIAFFINTYNHDHAVNLAALQTNYDQVVSKLNMTLNFNLPQQIKTEKREKLIKILDDLFKKQFYLEFDLKQTSDDQFIVDLICEERSKNIEIISTQKIQYYAGNTCENFGQQYLKELRRVILTFSSNLIEYSYEKRFYDKDIFFNLYFYLTFEQTPETPKQLQDLKKSITEQILKFSSSLSISKEQIRVNLKTIHPDEYVNLNVNQVLSQEKTSIQFSAIKNLHNQLKGNYHNRINFRDYYNRQVVIFLNQAEAKLTDQDESLGYFLNYEDDLFISGTIDNLKSIQTIFNRALIELYELNDIYLLSDSLQNTELDLNLKLISTYFVKREYFCTYQALYNQISTIIKLRNTRYIIFDEQSTKLIDKWLVQTEQLLKLNYIQNKSFQQIVYQQDDLNKIDEIGQLNYFSNEYYMGVYLPIIIPVAYPYILGVLGKYKEIKQAKKAN